MLFLDALFGCSFWMLFLDALFRYIYIYEGGKKGYLLTERLILGI